MQVLETERLPVALNCLGSDIDDDGYVSFWRFSEKQLAYYAEQPFFHLMSRCSSGVCLALETNGDILTLDCRTIDLNREVIDQIKGEMSFGEILQKLGETVRKVNQAGSRLDIIQHFDVYCDDHYQNAVRIGNGEIEIPLANPGHQWRQVRIWLPLYKPLSIRTVVSNGDMRAYTRTRPRMLALGDSITQGFVAGKPSFNYVAQLAELLEVDALNQGVGNMTYDPRILDGFEDLPLPDLITVAYGTNDWHMGESLQEITCQTQAFFDRLHTLFPVTPTYVLTPIWRDDWLEEKKTGSFTDLAGMIGTVAGQYPQVRLIDGLAVSPHNPACYSDGWLHPNIAGFSYLAPRLYRVIAGWPALAARLQAGTARV